MKFFLAAAAGAMTLIGAAGSASAAPVAAGNLKSAIAKEASQVEKTHGWHRSCRRGAWGWHRHTRWGRVNCGRRWHRWY